MSDKNDAGQDVPSIELLECPFCGDEDVYLEKDKAGAVCVWCPACAMIFQPDASTNSEKEATEHWNKRHSNDTDESRKRKDK